MTGGSINHIQKAVGLSILSIITEKRLRARCVSISRSPKIRHRDGESSMDREYVSLIIPNYTFPGAPCIIDQEPAA